MMWHRSRRQSCWVLGLALVVVGGAAWAESRTVSMGPLVFESSEELLSGIPTIDLNTGWVPGGSPVQAKLGLFLSPGYLKSRHSCYLVASYDTADIRPGATLPITISMAPAGADCFLRSGAGLMTEAKWRAGTSWFRISGDLPFLPNLDFGFQAHVGGYECPLPYSTQRIGAESSAGPAIPIPLYPIDECGVIFLEVQPGLVFKLQFRDLTGKLQIGGSSAPTDATERTFMATSSGGAVFNVQLPRDLRDMPDIRLRLSGVDYDDDLRISPKLGFALGASVGLAGLGDSQEGSSGSTTPAPTEPPDGDDNDYEISGECEALDLGSVSLSMTGVGYTTPSLEWDMSHPPLMDSPNLFAVGWDLPIRKLDAEGLIHIPPLPDLMVPQVTTERQGTSTLVHARVDNQGKVAVSSPTLTWRKRQGGSTTVLQTDTLPLIGTGGTAEATLTLPATVVGSYTIEAVADAAGAVTELCEDNNTGEVAVQATLDLAASLPGTFVFGDEAGSQAVNGDDLWPGRPYFMRATVSRGDNDLPVPAVAVEVWCRTYRLLRAAGAGGQLTATASGAAPVRLTRATVDLSQNPSATVPFCWTPPEGTDASYELSVRVDPEGQLAQSGASGNDTATRTLTFARPNPCAGSQVEASPGTGTTAATWRIGKNTRFRLPIFNFSPTRAVNVLVQVLLAGHTVLETTVAQIAGNGVAYVEFEQPYQRSDFRHGTGGDAYYDNFIELRAVVDPRNELADMRDALSGPDLADSHAFDAITTTPPPIGILTASLTRLDQPGGGFSGPFYQYEEARLRHEVGNQGNQSYPAGDLGSVPSSLQAIVGNNPAVAAQGLVDETVGLAPGATQGTEVTWRPMDAGQWTIVSRVTSPVPSSLQPALPSDGEPGDGAEAYLSDPIQTDNTVVKQVVVGLPRPDLQAGRLYVAKMPSVRSLTSLRRISGAVTRALSGADVGQTILDTQTQGLVAGLPTTLALQIANPPAAEGCPVIPAEDVVVKLYAAWEPGLQQHARLADAFQRTLEVGDELRGALNEFHTRWLDLVNRGSDMLVSTLNRGVPDCGLPRAGVRVFPDSRSIGYRCYGGRSNEPVKEAITRRARVVRDFWEHRTDVFIVGTQVLPRVEVGALVSFQWSPPWGGVWDLWAEVDPDDVVDERSDDNNRAEAPLNVRPSARYLVNTPPLAVAAVRVGRGTPLSAAGEQALEELAGAEPAHPAAQDLLPVDRGVGELWDELRGRVEEASAKVPTLARRRAISIKQGQVFTLLGFRTIDREHDNLVYYWRGPNVSVRSTTPNLVVDTSEPGMELATGLYQYTLYVCDGDEFMGTDSVWVQVSRGTSKAADLAPVWVSCLPEDAAPGDPVTFHVIVQNQGASATSKPFKVQVSVDGAKVAEKVVLMPMPAGEALELFLRDAWVAGLEPPAAGRPTSKTAAPARPKLRSYTATRLDFDADVVGRWQLRDRTVPTGEVELREMTHEVLVTVDPDNQVAEASDRNNALSKLVRVDGNASPRAILSADSYTVEAGGTVIVDAYHAYDPDGDLVRYDWLVDGRLQTGYHGRRLRFQAGTVAREHKLQLVVVDNLGKTDSTEASVKVVTDEGLPPVARAGLPVVVPAGRPLRLSAAGSYDPDGSLTGYHWRLGTQRGNGRELVVDTSAMRPGSYEVELTVDDAEGHSSSTRVPVEVVQAANHAPLVALPPCVRVPRGQTAVFDASGAMDPDGAVADFLWIVPGTGQVGNAARFEVPTADLSYGTHLVTVAVSDDDGATTVRGVLLVVTPAVAQPGEAPPDERDPKPLSADELRRLEQAPPTEVSRSGAK